MTLSLDRLRRSAKDLAKAHASGDPQALYRIRANPPRPDGVPLKHADFLHVIARETGFRSWPHLKLAAETDGLDRAARQQRLKHALYSGHHRVVDHLLSETPDLADGAFDLSCALYRVEAVEAALARDAGLAVTLFGPRRPILHLAFSRWFQHRPEREADMLAVADALLAHGANVDDGVPVEPGSEHLLSALYGAIGHGGNMPLGRWLLENGADPNDNESLYHATELGHLDGLKLLLANGADPKGTNALLRAMDFHNVDAVRLLLEHGARADDFVGTHVGGEAPWVVPALHQAARRGCGAEMVALLLDNGADPSRGFEGASAYGYARVFGNPVVADAIADRGMAVPLTPAEEVLARAADDHVQPGDRIDREALPEAYRNIVRMILHLPGRLDHVKRLVEIGMPFDAPDREGLTPVQVAGWEGLPDVMRYFLSLGPKIDHINTYGGGLVGTILHGSENAPDRATRDYASCLRLALEAGAPVLESEIQLSGREDLLEVYADWSDAT